MTASVNASILHDCWVVCVGWWLDLRFHLCQPAIPHESADLIDKQCVSCAYPPEKVEWLIHLWMVLSAPYYEQRYVAMPQREYYLPLPLPTLRMTVQPQQGRISLYLIIGCFKPIVEQFGIDPVMCDVTA